MSYHRILPYFNCAFNCLNNSLALPARLLQSRLSLKTEILPNVLQMPVNYLATIIIFFFVAIGFANNFICNMVGIVYPLLYSLPIYNNWNAELQRITTTGDYCPRIPNIESQLVPLNKYWMLFGAITVFDSLFGFLLTFIPGYYYFKLALVYGLVRNDFCLSNYIFDFINSKYSNLYPAMNKYVNIVRHRIKRSDEPKPEPIDKIE